MGKTGQPAGFQGSVPVLRHRAEPQMTAAVPIRGDPVFRFGQVVAVSTSRCIHQSKEASEQTQHRIQRPDLAERPGGNCDLERNPVTHEVLVWSQME
jgi:hypothetical protein